MSRKCEISICLDEIEASYAIMVKPKSNKDTISTAKSWVRKHKARLKELKYKGKIPRQPKLKEKEEISKDNLFNDDEQYQLRS